MPAPAAGRVAEQAVLRVRLWSCWRTGSRQFVEQRLCLFQISGVEALSEPAVDRGKQVAGFGTPTLLAPQPRETGGRAIPAISLVGPGRYGSLAAVRPGPH